MVPIGSNFYIKHLDLHGSICNYVLTQQGNTIMTKLINNAITFHYVHGDLSHVTIDESHESITPIINHGLQEQDYTESVLDFECTYSDFKMASGTLSDALKEAGINGIDLYAVYLDGEIAALVNGKSTTKNVIDLLFTDHDITVINVKEYAEY